MRVSTHFGRILRWCTLLVLVSCGQQAGGGGGSAADGGRCESGLASLQAGSCYLTILCGDGIERGISCDDSECACTGIVAGVRFQPFGFCDLPRAAQLGVFETNCAGAPREDGGRNADAGSTDGGLVV